MLKIKVKKSFKYILIIKQYIFLFRSNLNIINFINLDNPNPKY